MATDRYLHGDRLRRHAIYIFAARRRYQRELARLASLRWLR